MNSAAISVLAEAGIRGMDAETSLRRVLAALAAQGPDLRRELEALGVSPDAVDPALQRTVDVVRRLADAGLAADQARALFGADGASALLALIGAIERFEQLEAKGGVIV